MRAKPLGKKKKTLSWLGAGGTQGGITTDLYVHPHNAGIKALRWMYMNWHEECPWHIAEWGEKNRWQNSMCRLISLRVELHTWIYLCIFMHREKSGRTFTKMLCGYLWLVRSEVVFTFFFELFHIVWFFCNEHMYPFFLQNDKAASFKRKKKSIGTLGKEGGCFVRGSNLRRPVELERSWGQGLVSSPGAGRHPPLARGGALRACELPHPSSRLCLSRVGFLNRDLYIWFFWHALSPQSCFAKFIVIFGGSKLPGTNSILNNSRVAACGRGQPTPEWPPRLCELGLWGCV